MATEVTVLIRFEEDLKDDDYEWVGAELQRSFEGAGVSYATVLEVEEV